MQLRMTYKVSFREIEIKLQFLRMQLTYSSIHNIKLIIGVIVLLSLIVSFPTKLNAQIVFEDNTFPDVKIYEVNSEIFADVVVYKAPNSIFTGINTNSGVWYFTDNPSAANIKVGYVSAGIFADLKVFYTTSNIFAHWNNEEKRKWFASKLKNYNFSFSNLGQFEFQDSP